MTHRRSRSASTGLRWRKSSYSRVESTCVEIAQSDGCFCVRDSTHTELEILSFPTGEWHSFVKPLSGMPGTTG
ncbi:DUF397 domain-containing protein [Nocardiopsis aegyptia]|uniref:DUF397 domain-containing protein n=1 Tax=Nocardiopsis aegyptia TaxID=220378 RepID=A0A7Z0EQK3_9ACTN|nr:DUF397 domain-containing protein [Nocardiopsis aegyptia]NYJ36479.1 hypothetical protein [Nocardiopsis aegyptia]